MRLSFRKKLQTVQQRKEPLFNVTGVLISAALSESTISQEDIADMFAAYVRSRCHAICIRPICTVILQLLA